MEEPRLPEPAEHGQSGRLSPHQPACSTPAQSKRDRVGAVYPAGRGRSPVAPGGTQSKGSEAGGGASRCGLESCAANRSRIEFHLRVSLATCGFIGRTLRGEHIGVNDPWRAEYDFPKMSLMDHPGPAKPPARKFRAGNYARGERATFAKLDADRVPGCGPSTPTDGRSTNWRGRSACRPWPRSTSSAVRPGGTSNESLGPTHRLPIIHGGNLRPRMTESYSTFEGAPPRPTPWPLEPRTRPIAYSVVRSPRRALDVGVLVR